ncbi:RluA family pseudouridine synthase [Neobacillus sp. SM06]|uniref:RluA family pseudouridine synthase n=1 Tax=Neobacillus sp. SM06 TaxID=3422492 RepID=UPI003D2843F4
MALQFRLNWLIEPTDTGKLVRDFAKEKDISRSALTDIKFKGGKILVNKAEVNVRYRLQQEDFLEIIFPPETKSDGVAGEEIPLDIVYEDEFVLVINKPPGMNTIPSREHPAGSLANALIGYYEKSGIEATAHIVTRLDRNTSGLVLIAKHRHVHHLFSRAQQNGGVKRGYEAFVSGKVAAERGTIEQPIGRKAESIIEREVREDGQYACTHFKVLARAEDYSHLELRLETGRTHQIRVHMLSIGHPLLGDDLYGGSTERIKRQALHCKQLAFWHPFLNKQMKFTIPLPEDMKKLTAE